MNFKILNNYEFYGKCAKLQNKNGNTLIVTLDVGPRIVYFGNENVNVFYQDKENLIKSSGIKFDEAFNKKGESWNIYGGHRLWKSPEDFSSYAPDNYPVKYSYENDTLILVSNVEILNNIEKTIEISLTEKEEFKIVHKIKNCGKDSVKMALWCLSVMDKDGICIAPVNNKETGWLPNRNYVFWSYASEKDNRFNFHKNYITLKQDNNNENAFKVGYFNPYGKLAYFYKNCLFIKSYDCTKEGEYPDFHCNTELYTNNIMLEMESLSPLYTMNNNETYSHTEIWEFNVVGEKTTDEIYKIIM